MEIQKIIFIIFGKYSHILSVTLWCSPGCRQNTHEGRCSYRHLVNLRRVPAQKEAPTSRWVHQSLFIILQNQRQNCALNLTKPFSVLFCSVLLFAHGPLSSLYSKRISIWQNSINSSVPRNVTLNRELCQLNFPAFWFLRPPLVSQHKNHLPVVAKVLDFTMWHKKG